jgi:hypothetical protein
MSDGPVSDERSRRWVPLGLVLVLVLIGVAVIWYLFSSDGAEESEGASTTTSGPTSSTGPATTTTELTTTTTELTTTTTTLPPLPPFEASVWASEGTTGLAGLWFGPDGDFEAYVAEWAPCESVGLAPSEASLLGFWASEDPTIVTVRAEAECYPATGGATPIPNSVEVSFDRPSVDRLLGSDGEGYVPVGGTLLGVWHRNSSGVHEVTFCSARGDVVTCETSYGLGVESANRGRFEGVITDDCTSFDTALCDDAQATASGVTTVTTASGEPIGLTIDQLLVLRSDGSMALEWVDKTGGDPGFRLPFHCPWHRSWAVALASPDDCTQP